MDLGIKGKRALVTGAGRGIGRAVASALAAEGCRLAVLARTKKNLEGLVRELGGGRGGHVLCAADLTRAGAAAAAVRALTARRDDFDIVVHCVGGTLGIHDPLAPASQWQQVWRLNAGAAIDLNALVAPAMRKKGWGRIIHVSSFAAENLRSAAPYAAAKTYLNAYTKLLGGALAKDGIVVSAVMPGAVLVPGGRWDQDAEANRRDPVGFRRQRAEFFRHYQPLGRLGAPEEVARLVLFLASAHSSFAAGSVVALSGGGV